MRTRDELVEALAQAMAGDAWGKPDHWLYCNNLRHYARVAVDTILSLTSEESDEYLGILTDSSETK